MIPDDSVGRNLAPNGSASTVDVLGIMVEAAAKITNRDRNPRILVAGKVTRF